MKKQSMKSFLKSLTALMLCMCVSGSALADVLKLPAGVKVIEEEAFYGVQSIDEVVLPEGVEEIGPRAFADSSVTAVNLPDSLTEIADDAFDPDADIDFSVNEGTYAWDWVEEQTPLVPSPVSDFEFSDNDDGTCTVSRYIGNDNVVVIPNTNAEGRAVIQIGDSAFKNCDSLTSITIPKGVTSIGEWAFKDCESLTSVTIPKGVTSIGRDAFFCCSSLTSITIPESVTSIGNAAFSSCSSLTSITIPEGVTWIENLTFYNCWSLTSITIPKGVTSIGEVAFLNCRSLTNIYCVEDSYAWNWFVYYGYENFLIPWDGDPSSLPAVHQLSGSFTNHTITVALGDPLLIPAGRVSSRGADIYRVTLTIDNWNQDGTNANRYRTHTFEGQNLKEISLTDPEWASHFTLDTTQPPLNAPGEYTINLWASTVEGEGVKLDSMTVNVTVGEIGFTGAFEEEEILLVPGHSIRPSGVITSYDGEIEQVILKIDGYPGDENGFYKYKLFSDHHTQTVQLSDWAEFALNTTTEPLNQTGAYIVYLLAKTADSEIVQLDELTVYVGWEGYIQSASTVDTYATATAKRPNGYVDNLDPVIVFREANNRYQIQMILTAGGTAIRWVDKTMVKNTYFSWRGYIHALRIPLYRNADDIIFDEYLENSGPVTVLSDTGNRYQIQVVLENQETVIRWVDKKWISNSGSWSVSDSFGSVGVNDGEYGQYRSTEYNLFASSSVKYSKVVAKIGEQVIAEISEPDTLVSNGNTVYQYRKKVPITTETSSVAIQIFGWQGNAITGKAELTFYLIEEETDSVILNFIPTSGAQGISEEPLDGSRVYRSAGSVTVLGYYPNKENAQWCYVSYSDAESLMMRQGFARNEDVSSEHLWDKPYVNGGFRLVHECLLCSAIEYTAGTIAITEEEPVPRTIEQCYDSEGYLLKVTVTSGGCQTVYTYFYDNENIEVHAEIEGISYSVFDVVCDDCTCSYDETNGVFSNGYFHTKICTSEYASKHMMEFIPHDELFGTNYHKIAMNQLANAIETNELFDPDSFEQMNSGEKENTLKQIVRLIAGFFKTDLTRIRIFMNGNNGWPYDEGVDGKHGDHKLDIKYRGQSLQKLVGLIAHELRHSVQLSLMEGKLICDDLSQQFIQELRDNIAKYWNSISDMKADQLQEVNNIVDDIIQTYNLPEGLRSVIVNDVVYNFYFLQISELDAHLIQYLVESYFY